MKDWITSFLLDLSQKQSESNMKHIVDKTLIKLQNVSLTSKTMHTKTGDICKISQELFKELEDKSIHNVLNICKELLDTRNWKLSVIAFDFA